MNKVVILTVGNVLRRDDGLGHLVAQKMEKNMNGFIFFDTIFPPVFDGGDVPENYLEKILRCRPEVVLIIDTVHFNGTPGEVRIFEKEELSHCDFSTHGISLKMAMEYLENRGVKEIKLIGVQPMDTKLGEGLSKEVRQSLDKVISLCMSYR